RVSALFFLLDTGKARKTDDMVRLFMEKMEQEGFRKLFIEEFIKFNDNCIRAFLKGDTKDLFANLRHLSRFAYEFFMPMIPSIFRKLWRQGLDTGTYYLKLCGAGGGGFILGFTEDLKKAETMLKGYKIEVVYRF
ncbi:MAG: mevalonate kinase, partial [Spirulinaceae cyanobacterium RM2_2_10]|nr:mevalonate kinase [Spirulinaceae cyanobacterium RM2_2_10]